MISLNAEDIENREAREISICNELYTVLNGIPRPLHDAENKLVFTYLRKRRGKEENSPLSDIRDGLRDACEKTGIAYGRFVKGGFVFHDLRHCFHTCMRKAGVAESVIMEITGHSTREMFERYNTVDQDDRRQPVDQSERYLRPVDHPVDQEAKKE